MVLAVFVMYVILAILYESYLHPITVLSSLPVALVGGLLTLQIFGAEASLYAFIGMFMLMGIVKKNGIMIVDFAQQRVEQGLKDDEAIHEASMERFRPIMMTTMAALMGALPIALGFGADGSSRRPLGLVVVGGLIVSQFITLYVTPAIYLYLEEFQEKVLDRTSFFRSHRVHAPQAERRRRARRRLSARMPNDFGAKNNCARKERPSRMTGPTERFSARAGRWAALAVLLALSGCSVGPKYQTPTVQTPTAYKEPTAQTVYEPEPWKVAQPSDAVIPGKWWETFGDADLNALEEKINISNQNVASAAANFLAARALVKQARAQYYPTVAAAPALPTLGLRPPQFGGIKVWRVFLVVLFRFHVSASPRLRPIRCRSTPPGSPISGAASATRSMPTSLPRRLAPPTSRTCASPCKPKSPSTTSSCARRMP